MFKLFKLFKLFKVWYKQLRVMLLGTCDPLRLLFTLKNVCSGAASR